MHWKNFSTSYFISWLSTAIIVMETLCHTCAFGHTFTESRGALFLASLSFLFPKSASSCTHVASKITIKYCIRSHVLANGIYMSNEIQFHFDEWRPKRSKSLTTYDDINEWEHFKTRALILNFRLENCIVASKIVQVHIIVRGKNAITRHTNVNNVDSTYANFPLKICTVYTLWCGVLIYWKWEFLLNLSPNQSRGFVSQIVVQLFQNKLAKCTVANGEAFVSKTFRNETIQHRQSKRVCNTIYQW